MQTRNEQNLTTRQFAETLGVSESSVKRWVDGGRIQAFRTAGGHRRIPVADAVRFIRRTNAHVAEPQSLPLSTAPQLGPVDADAASELAEHLKHDRAEPASALLAGRFLAGAEIATIGDRLIQPALEQVGMLWHHADDGILAEHRALDTCMQTLAHLAVWLPELPENAPAAVTAAGPDDPYTLPPLLTHLTARERGLRAKNLGPNTPPHTTALAVQRYNAVLCCISFSTEARTDTAWADLAERLASTKVRLVIGGRASHTAPRPVADTALKHGSLAEFAAYASGLVQGISSPGQPLRNSPTPEAPND